MTAVPGSDRLPSGLGAAVPTRGKPGSQPNRLLYALLLLGIVIVVGPFIWMLLGSFKPQADFLRNPPPFLPTVPTLDNYNLLICPMLGYALAKLRWRGKRIVLAVVLATLMVPAGVTLVPNFVLMSSLD